MTYLQPNSFRFALIIALCLLQVGCRGGAVGSASGVEERFAKPGAVLVDAYLFDAKVREGGHLRSVRLQIFYADTIALITARGYLGKGVGKGIWRADSSLFYFPTENEFYSGPIDKLTQLECLDARRLQQWLPDLLSTDPRRIIAIEGLEVDQRSEKEIKATLSLGDCPRPLSLEFNSPRKDGRFYLSEVEYRAEDGKKLFGAQRRTLKAQSDIELRKFTLSIPTDALRISLD